MKASTSDLPAQPALGDFSTTPRVLLLCLLALPIGAIGAVVAKSLLWLIAVITNLAFFARLSASAASPEGNHLGLWVIAVPVAGSLVIGLMARYGSEKIRGHGIPEALEAILLGRSLIDPKVAVLKPVSSAISIGTGGPFGAEGPIIMTGGAFGSLFAQLFHLTAAERKTLLAAGAAAGMAAVFGSPVASVLLAVELLLFEWKPRSLIPVTVAALAAALARVPLLGAGPIFPVPLHGPIGVQGLGTAVAVGVLTGLGSGTLTSLVYLCEDLFAKLRLHWMWWPALGGLAVGTIGYLEPRVLGVGYDTIHVILLGRLVGVSLIVLVLAKSVAWSVALGSGTSGGVLAPLLMIGGAIGALLASAAGIGDPGLWALVGMAAMMGGHHACPVHRGGLHAGGHEGLQRASRPSGRKRGRALRHGAPDEALDPDGEASPQGPARRLRVQRRPLRAGKGRGSDGPQPSPGPFLHDRGRTIRQDRQGRPPAFREAGHDRGRPPRAARRDRDPGRHHALYP